MSESTTDFVTAEPSFAPWRLVPFGMVRDDALGVARARRDGPPRVIAVDGRSGAGKTTLAARLADALSRAVVVHTDDVAWHHSFFDWQGPMIEHVLAPARAGRAVAWRPTPWIERGREGRIEVPAGTEWLVVEGVGASRHELVPYLDATLWVASDPRVARERELARDGAGELAFIEEWAAAERPFLERQTPWKRADLVICGTPETAPPDDHVMIA